jgi:Lon protease-like protein
MNDPQPPLAELPESFPVFPLTGALLLPGGRLPLNIFEPRYLAMIDDALGHGRMFAMIQPDPSRAAGPHGPNLYRIGCLGRLSSFSETEDGRYLITLTGVIRFEIVEELPMVRGYRRVRGDFSRFAADLAEPDAHGLDRKALLEALRDYFSRRGFDANWDAIDAMEDVPLVTSLAMVCPFDPVEKQALLESANLADCCATLHTLLRIDTHEAPDDPDDGSPTGRRMAS